MTARLRRLFQPKSIAVVGGGTWCRNVIEQSRRFGFAGPIWPVHPSKSDLEGERAYRSVKELPAPPDATFIGINRHATVKTVGDLAALGAGGGICFASGFQEAQQQDSTGPALQQQLLYAAGKMPILGPNCYGFINYLDGALLWPDQHGGVRTDRGVAIVTQSSNMAISMTMQRRALPLAYIVTAGNQAQTSLAEIGATLLDDVRVTALGLHIEGVGDIAALEALAQKASALNKPIIALKVGRSDQARTATVSHTASLAGSDAGARAMLKRLGIALANSLPEFLEALKLLHVTGPLESRRLVAMSCSGGEASLMADLAQDHNVQFPPLNALQKTNLRAALGPMVKLANPLDYHTYIWKYTAAMASAFSAMTTDETALGIVVSDFPRNDRCDASDWDCVLGAVTEAQKRTGIPFAVAASLPENMPEDIANRLISANIAPLCGLQEAIVAARIAAECGRIRPATQPILLPEPAKNVVTLNEADAKAKLAHLGIHIPQSAQANAIKDLARSAATLQYPLVLKGLGLGHKTEAGAVALGLSNSDQVLKAAEKMQARGYLLEEMITGTVAELLIGVVLDPAHGYVLTLGAGGILAEVFDDTTSLLLPVTAEDIQAALSNLRIFKILHGYRNQPAADITAIVSAVQTIQAYVIQHPGRIEEVEVNPLLCLPTRAIAADALIRIGEKDDRQPD